MWSEPRTPEPETSRKLPKFTLFARLVTLISLGISVGIKKSNHQPFDNSYQIASYKYMAVCLLVGIAYTLLQTPFAIYYAIRGRRMFNQYKFLQVEFYGDLVVLCILGTAVGASLGVTTDFKDFLYNKSDHSRFTEYFNMAYVSAGFLLIGFTSTGVSSILSSKPISSTVEE